MTITEANAVNKVLRQLVAAVNIRGLRLSDEAVEAGSVLAAKANKVLGAGLTAAGFREAIDR